MDKNTVIALAAAFGILTEGLKPKELQEALDASEGYKMYQDALKAKEAGESQYISLQEIIILTQTSRNEAEAKVTELEGELSAAKQTIADQQHRFEGAKIALDIEIEKRNMAEQKVFNLEQTLAELAETEEDNRILFTSDNGNTYEVIPEKFRFQGSEYQSADAVYNHRDILEAQVAAKSFILKKV